MIHRFLLLILSTAQDCAPLREVRSYIHHSWKTLTRSNASLADSAIYSKVAQNGPVTQWVAADEDSEKIRGQQNVNVRKLSDPPAYMQESGLLYLPERYVVPGGRFNEM